MHSAFENQSSELRLFWVCTLRMLFMPSPRVSRLASQWLGWLPQPCHVKTPLGFTLAELLVSLAILGVIATFTIPKIIAGQQNARYSAEAKELASTISAIYINAYNSNGGEDWVNNPIVTVPPSNGDSWDNGFSMAILPSFSYVKELNSSYTMTYPPDGSAHVYGGFQICQANQTRCFLLHNGGVLWYVYVPFGWNGEYAQNFLFDPDSDGPLESVGFRLFVSGRSKTLDASGVYKGGRVLTFNQFYGASSPDPVWLNW